MKYPTSYEYDALVSMFNKWFETCIPMGRPIVRLLDDLIDHLTEKQPLTKKEHIQRLTTAPTIGDYWESIIFICGHKDLPIEWLIGMAKTFTPEHQRGWANGPAARLEMKAEAAIFSNPRLPEEILWQAASYPMQYRRAAVASNPRCPIDILEQLAHDRAIGVRDEVERHPNTPDNIKKLIQKRNF